MVFTGATDATEFGAVSAAAVDGEDADAGTTTAPSASGTSAESDGARTEPVSGSGTSSLCGGLIASLSGTSSEESSLSSQSS